MLMRTHGNGANLVVRLALLSASLAIAVTNGVGAQPAKAPAALKEEDNSTKGRLAHIDNCIALMSQSHAPGAPPAPPGTDVWGYQAKALLRLIGLDLHQDDVAVWRRAAQVAMLSGDDDMAAFAFEAIVRLRPDYQEDEQLRQVVNDLKRRPIQQRLIPLAAKHAALIQAEIASKNGDPAATCTLAEAYYQGDGVPRDVVRAADLYEQAANKGNATAMRLLGDFYSIPLARPKDDAIAMNWYQRAAAAGDAGAAAKLDALAHPATAPAAGSTPASTQESTGVVSTQPAPMVIPPLASGPPDPAHDREFVVARDGNAAMMYRIGNRYAYVSQFVESVKWYVAAADKGQSGGMMELGNLCHFGNGVPLDEALALQCYRKAAAGDNAYAMNSVAVMYERGLGVPADDAEALKWYDRAAAAGNPYAKQHADRVKKGRADAKYARRHPVLKPEELAERASKGDGLAMFLMGREFQNKDDIVKAVEWYEKSAATGNAAAINALGIVQFYGFGTPKDPAKAVERFEKVIAMADAADPEDLAEACYYLGRCSDKGLGLPKDRAKTREWFQRSAELGNAASMFMTGMLLVDDNDPAELDEITNRVRQAAEHGYTPAMDWMGKRHGGNALRLSDVEVVLDWALLAAEQGDARASRKVDSMTFNDECPLAARAAAAKGDISAMASLCRIFFKGLGVPQDTAIATEWARKGLEAGSSLPMINLGACYLEGKGGPKDAVKALEILTPYADKGDLNAIYTLAYHYDEGTGLTRDREKAFGMFLSVAEKGSLIAMGAVANGYRNGNGTPKDLAKALLWAQKGAAAGEVRSMVVLGMMYHFGEGVPVDRAKAREWYTKGAEGGNADGAYNLRSVEMDEKLEPTQKAAEAGDAEAMYQLGRAYFLMQHDGFNEIEGRKWLIKAADAGHLGAMRMLGDIGFAVQANTVGATRQAWYWRAVAGLSPLAERATQAEALAWYRKAADRGDAESMRRVGEMYLQGQGVLSMDPVRAHAWFTKAAGKNDISAVAYLGEDAMRGRGTAVDDAAALKLFHQAADGGNTFAMLSLAYMISNGRGTPKDLGEARRWCEKAAYSGDADAKKKLESFYNQPQIREETIREGVAKGDPEQMAALAMKLVQGKGSSAEEAATAPTWAQKAADAGSPTGMYLLGLIYQRGISAPPNAQTALQWYRKAAEHGDSEAAFKVGEMLAAMTPPNGKDQQKGENPVDWYRKAADGLSLSGMISLATACWQGDGTPKDDAQAFRWFRRASMLGDIRGMVGEALLYESGGGVRADFDRALKLYHEAGVVNGNPTALARYQALMAQHEQVRVLREAALVREDPDAMLALGRAYLSGTGVTREDALAFLWFRRAARKGNAAAALLAADMLANGAGVVANPAEMMEVMKPLLARKDPRALALVGRAQLQGKGGKLDDLAALKTLAEAALAGDQEASFTLGSAYYTGQGTPASGRIAEKFWLLAARGGHGSAMMSLAHLYEEGFGIPANAKAATAWYRLAADKGVPGAKAAAERKPFDLFSR